MRHTFADTLKSVSTYIPESLISPAEFSKLINISEKFPSFLSPGAGFESRLGESKPSLDFFLSIDRDNRFIPAGIHPKLEMDKSLLQDPIWQNIQFFCKEWSIANSPLDKYANRLFFEFDIGDVISDIPIPAVFMQINEKMYKANGKKLEQKSKTLEKSDCEWIFSTLSVLKNGSISLNTLKNTLNCFENLLPGTYIDHIAIMSSRSPDVIRINITNLHQDTLYQYLDRIGLTAQIPQLQNSLPGLCNYSNYMVLALDIGETIYPKIGIEFRLSKDSLHLSTQHKWHSFLDYLVENGLCTKEKREGLINWSGRSREIFDPVLYRFIIYRYINLIKAVYVPHKPIEIKGYFSFFLHSLSQG